MRVSFLEGSPSKWVMMRFFAFAALVAVTPGAFAQAAPNVAKPVVSDVATPDAIIHSLYDVISGPAGTRDWDRMRSLFDPKALMAAMYKRRNGEIAHITFTVDDYIRMDSPFFEKNSFYEREASRKMEQYGSIADIFSTYESRHEKADAKPFEVGINDIQLYHADGRWWILSINWQGDDTGVPVPKKYLR